MAKSTNHTAHNQSYKNHRNGIKKPMRLGKGQRRPIKGVRPYAPQPARRRLLNCRSRLGVLCACARRREGARERA